MPRKLFGIIPPVVTPFTADGQVDEAAFRAQLRFMLEKGVHGVCVGGSTGEGHTLRADEFRRLIAAATDEIAGRMPVIAGIITNSTLDAIERAKAIAKYDVAALQITPVHYLFRPHDDATFGHFRHITREIDTPVIIYNVVPWNYLSPALLVRIMKKLPGVIGVKQSAGDLKLLADLLVEAPRNKVILTAVDALLYPAFALGAQGVIAANPAAAPGPCVALWNAVQRGDHGLALTIHKALLRFWNALCAENLPANVKTALGLQGCPAGHPREPMPASSKEQRTRIAAALKEVLRFEEASASAD